MRFISIKNPAILAVIVILNSIIPTSSAQTTTNIQVSNAIQQASVTRLGVNLGDQDYWDSGQIMKSLGFRNPGFEGMKFRSILKCIIVTANTCQDDNQYSTQPTGFWTGGTYRILSGNSAGVTGNVVSSQAASSCNSCGQIIKFDKDINPAVGDYFSVVNYFPGNGDQGWWDAPSGGGTISTETTDLSPNTPGKQALVLNASGSGQSAAVTQYWDTFTGHTFTQMNGNFQVTFRAKGIGGNNQLEVAVARLQPGLGPYLDQTVTLTNAWQDYTLTFSASENGSAVGNMQLAFSAAGGSIELDDTSLVQTNSSSSNPTVFRDDVVNALKQLNPGTIRMMASGAALGSDIPNQLNLPFARYREGFNSGGHEVDDISYGIHEFLQLCATVGSDPWITIPTATTPQEMTDFIDYLTGTGADSFSALRIARGQSAPWTTVFHTIHIEFGNETWNGDFKGESMAYPAYPQLANQIFGAARATGGFDATKFDLVLDGWAAVPGYNSAMLAFSTQHDSIDIAPYLLYSANNEPQATMFGALFAEPEMFDTAGGEVFNNYAATQAAATPTNLNVYESNLGSVLGTITQTQLDKLTPSVGAGLAAEEHMLQMMRLGVKVQNAFALPQYDFLRDDGSLVKLWGIVVDMGSTNRRRPQFLTEALGNGAIGGSMLQTVQSGANPTWNQPLSSDGVYFNGAHYLQSFAFNNNGTVSVLLFNLNQTTALPVTFSGANAPSGTVQMGRITSANITDNNESSDVVQATSQTLSNFNPSTPFSLPPFSMTVLTMNSTSTQVPTFSVPGGSYSSQQTVGIVDATPRSTIYYTTDGTTPTTASTVYTTPITVSSSETIQAIATSPGLSTSAVGLSAYDIGQTTTATPSFSMVAGSYSSAVSVQLSDATPGASIYYTTDGSTPTTSSTLYSAAIQVKVTEKISAIAAANQHSLSSVISEVFTITPKTEVAATPLYSLKPGDYSTAQTVSLSDSTPAAIIYYTTNGTAPSTSSSKYASPIKISASTTIKSMAVATHYNPSAVASAEYTINSTIEVASAPSFSLKSGAYATAQVVSLKDETKGAIIYYTTNGVKPTSNSPRYTAPIEVKTSETIKAVATAPGFQPSVVAAGVYTILEVASTPKFSIRPGIYKAAQTVTLSDASAGTTIYFTLNGTTPTLSSSKYTQPISVSKTETIKAMAYGPAYTASAIASAEYVITPVVASVPTFSVKSGTYKTAQIIKLTDASNGATIYFTINGKTPTVSSTRYYRPFKVNTTETVKAIAGGANFAPSAVAVAEYKITPLAALPTFSVKPGTYESAPVVALKDASAGATIYFTINGTTPTTSSDRYNQPFRVTKSETVKAIAAGPEFASSAVAAAEYKITPPAALPTFSVKPGTYKSAPVVELKDSSVGATIYFTIDGTTPTVSSARYNQPFRVIKSETVKAIAAGPDFAPSAVASASYKISAASAQTLIESKETEPQQEHAPIKEEAQDPAGK